MEESQRLNYKVISYTSQDLDNPADNLPKQSQAHPWHSQRFCVYPQLITFAFEKPVTLTQIKIVAHEYKVPSKISLGSMMPGTQTEFKWLGQFDLEKPSGQGTRELKTVFMDVDCLLIQISLAKCYEG